MNFVSVYVFGYASVDSSLTPEYKYHRTRCCHGRPNRFVVRPQLSLVVCAPRKRSASVQVKAPAWKGLTTHHYRVLHLRRSGANCETGEQER